MGAVAHARIDATGETYLEIRAVESGGCASPFKASVVQSGGTVAAATRVTIVANSFWWVTHDSNDPRIGPDGRVLPGFAEGQVAPRMGSFKAPNLPAWSLIARWEKGGATVLSDYFEVGNGGTFPVPAQAHEYDHLDIGLNYFCNDNDYSDNSGWLHVYETYA